MPKQEYGMKCLVDTCIIGIDDNSKRMIFVEMDGFSWDSTEYKTLEEFLQSIIDHAYQVSMGKE